MLLLHTATQGDPTGLSSPLGKIIVIAGLVAALIVSLRWWYHRRR